MNQEIKLLAELSSAKNRLSLFGVSLEALSVFGLFRKKKLKTKLIKDLRQACDLAARYSGGYSSEFSDAQAFYQSLDSAVTDFESGNDALVTKLYHWFSPTAAWDDFIGEEGADLGHSIFKQLHTYLNK